VRRAAVAWTAKLAAAALVLVLAACGDDGGGYSAFTAEQAQDRCETLIAEACGYFVDCGAIGTGDVAACVIESRAVLRCDRAVDTSWAYSACVNELAGGSCDAADRGSLPAICSGVILTQ
jgi:hypothetical protein